MKKILMLGGAWAQIPAIQRAKEMGLYVISCDYLPNNPGHKFADEYRNISTVEKDQVLELARSEGIDGIIAYASDPSAVTAAYVGEKLGLPGGVYDAVGCSAKRISFGRSRESTASIRRTLSASGIYANWMRTPTRSRFPVWSSPWIPPAARA